MTAPDSDLADALAARYQGEALLQRLRFLAERMASDESAAATHAVQILLQTLQTNGNTRGYRSMAASPTLAPLLLLHRMDSSSPQPTTTTATTSLLEPSWCSDAELQSQHELELLSARLAAAQSHLHKDAIRTAYTQLAEHHVANSRLPEALAAAHRAKDYCTTRTQTIQVSLEWIVPIAMYMNEWNTVRDHVHKLQHTVRAETAGTDHAAPTAVLSKVSMAAGLEELQKGQYAAAAEHFRTALTGRTGEATCQSWPQVLAREEVTLYAGVLSMVTASRLSIMELAEHVDALELAPPALKESMVLLASRSKYKECWTLLDTYIFPWLAVDMFMVQHLEQLKALLVEKLVRWYWQPLCRVSLATMVQDLGSDMLRSVLVGQNDSGSTMERLESLLIRLIRTNQLPNTRISLKTRTLERLVRSSETELLEKTRSNLLEVSDRVLNESYSMVVRLACLENGLVVKGGSGAAKDLGSRMQHGSSSSGASGPLAGEAQGAYEGEDSDGSDPDVALMEVSDDLANPEDLY